ncbi:hypothetical protein HY230_01465 [Candidatus Acetothermia bacterium]|nr:hypothetical protein [Candidatus Acetothermia bacterium]
MIEQHRKRNKQVVVVASVVALLGLMSQIPSSADPPPATGPHLIPVVHCDTLNFPDFGCTFIGDLKVTKGPRPFPPIKAVDAGHTAFALENTAVGGVTWTMESEGVDGTSNAMPGRFRLFNPAATAEPGEPIPTIEGGTPAFMVDAKQNIAIGRSIPIPEAKVHIHGGASTGKSLLIDSAGSTDLIMARRLSTTGGPPTEVFKVTLNGKVTTAGGFHGQCLKSTDPAFNANTSRDCNMDMAEAFASIELTEPGDLVVLVPDAVNTPTVRKSAQPYKGLLVGVVSTNPGLVFDNGQTYLAGDNSQLITKDKTVVAAVGRVLAKVSLENGPIRVGDPLTSSSKPGVAMRATKAGKIVGYALENAKSDGKILIWLQPGTYIPENLLDQLNQLGEK